MGILYPDKPFKTYQEQIDILENRYGLVINNKNFAETALRSLTYYDLVNGYKNCFMTNEKFNPGTTIEQLYLFYNIDKGFQSILFKYSTVVENSFKSKLAYIISANFGVWEDEYLDANNYYKTNNKVKFSEVKAACLSIYENTDVIPQPTKHYLEKHNHIPAWILFKNLSFSNSINFFQLLKQPEKRALSDLLITSHKVSSGYKIAYLLSALNIIRSYRNKIAHNLKFVTYKSAKHWINPKTTTRLVPKEIVEWHDFNKYDRGKADIYAYIICLWCLIDDYYLRQFFCSEIHDYFYAIENSTNPLYITADKEYKRITNIPENITERMDKYLKKSIAHK